MTVLSQNTPTLEECIDYAMSHNLEIKQQEIAIKRQKVEYTKSVFAHLPSIYLNGSDETSKTSSSKIREYGFSATGEWVVFSGFSRQYERMATKYELEATQLEDDRLRNEISLQITRAYLQIILCEELAECSKIEYNKILEEKNRILFLVKAGRQPASASFNIEAQCSTEYSNMINAQCKLRSSIMELSQIMDVPFDSTFQTRIKLMREIPAPPSITYGEIESFAAARPDILALHKLEKSRKSLLSAAKGAAAPKIAVTASYSMSNMTGDSQNRLFGLEVTIPIMDGYYTASRIKESNLELSRVRYEKQESLLKMISLIQSSVIEAENLYNMVIAAQRRLSAAESLLEASSSKLKSGGITAAEYSVARSDYLTAKSESIQYKWRYIFQLKIVDFYRGIPIEL